jgi:tRNA(Arg) A34 adenosine deaminase TadA
MRRCSRCGPPLRRRARGGDNGACGTLYNLCADPRLNHEIEVVHGVEAGAAAELLDRFFATRRA